MDYSTLVPFISQVGFPIFIATFILVKHSKVIENNTLALIALKENCNMKGKNENGK